MVRYLTFNGVLNDCSSVCAPQVDITETQSSGFMDMIEHVNVSALHTQHRDTNFSVANCAARLEAILTSN